MLGFIEENRKIYLTKGLARLLNWISLSTGSYSARSRFRASPPILSYRDKMYIYEHVIFRQQAISTDSLFCQSLCASDMTVGTQSVNRCSEHFHKCPVLSLCYEKIQTWSIIYNFLKLNINRTLIDIVNKHNKNVTRIHSHQSHKHTHVDWHAAHIQY